MALFAQNGSDFYDLPYPNDLRRHDDGSLDLSKFPTNSFLVDMYRADAEKLDGFVVPLTDEHMSEYVGSYAQRLAWLTGFQGSAGSALA